MQRCVAETQPELHGILVVFRLIGIEQPDRPRNRNKQRETRIEAIPDRQLLLEHALLDSLAFRLEQVSELELPDHAFAVIHKRLGVRNGGRPKQSEQ